MKFVANDGMEFRRYEDCAQYESNPPFIMYNDCGRTYSAEEAKVVHIIRPEGCHYFCALCSQDGLPSDGIRIYPGWYYWNENKEEYCDIECDILAILKQNAF